MRRVLLTARTALGILATAPIPTAYAQQVDATTLVEMVQRLGSTSRALVITERPEQEPAGLVAWLHLKAGAEVAVLALHRGEASGNRYGREIGEALGVLRVQELQQVRRQAGGRQFYTRAYDLGGLGPDGDPWQAWPRQRLLADIVTVIRSFRPQVLIVGCPAPGGTVDPESTAAMELAREAFTAAGDSTSVSLEDGYFRPPWHPTHLYQEGCVGEPTVRVALGDQHLPRAASFSAIGARALTAQRSQGLGARASSESTEARLELIQSLLVASADRVGVFHGIPTNWRESGDDPDLAPPRQDRARELGRAIAAIQDSFDARTPGRSLPAVLDAVRAVRSARALVLPSVDRRLPWREEESEQDAALNVTEARLVALALATAGIEARWEANRAWVAQGDSLPAQLTIINRGEHPVVVLHGQVEYGRVHQLPVTDASRLVAPGDEGVWHITLRPLDASAPWWLMVRRVGDAYTYPPARNAPAELLTGGGSSLYGRAAVRLLVAGVELPLLTDPVGAVVPDPDRGLVREPVMVMPAVTVLLERMLDYVPADQPSGRRLRAEIRSWTDRPREVVVRVEAPPGVTVADERKTLTLAPGGIAEVEFDLGVLLPRERHALRVYAESDGETFVQGVIPIRYPHIDPVVVYRPSGLWLDAVPVSVPGTAEIGYVAGGRDFNNIALRQLLLRVTDLSPAALDSTNLSRLRRIAIGPGALTPAEARHAVPALLDWIRRGGRLVVHDGDLDLLGSGLLPWPVLLDAPPRRIQARGAWLAQAPGAERWWRTPHRLDDADIDDWRAPAGQLVIGRWDARYLPIALAHEIPGDAGIPVAWSTRIGRGTLIYTTLQLPTQVLAGEGGALRLLLNFLFAPDGS